MSGHDIEAAAIRAVHAVGVLAPEIVVELDNTGELRAITQEPAAGTFQRGERVRLVTGGGVTRVEKLAKD